MLSTAAPHQSTTFSWVGHVLDNCSLKTLPFTSLYQISNDHAAATLPERGINSSAAATAASAASAAALDAVLVPPPAVRHRRRLHHLLGVVRNAGTVVNPATSFRIRILLVIQSKLVNVNDPL